MMNAKSRRDMLRQLGIGAAVLSVVPSNFLSASAPATTLTGSSPSVSTAQSETGASSGGVLTGLDVLIQNDFAPLRARHVGLITNQTGRSRDGKRNVDLMLAAGIQVHALFSPESGFWGKSEAAVIPNSVDPVTHLPIYSLYNGNIRRPTPQMLKGIDTLVFDIQDVGARFYTYNSTMTYAMEEASRRHLSFYVLDRPNPITGDHLEGPVLDKDLESFVGCARVPIWHGLTLGEFAQFVNGQQGVGADLHVVRMNGWRRSDWWDETDLTWIDPSPEMTSLPEALLYPGSCLLQGTPNFSVGVGTRVPYQQVGADWLDARKLAGYLNARAIPGVCAYPTRFRPSFSLYPGKALHYAGKSISGVRFVVTDRDRFNSVRLGLELIHAIEKLYPGKINVDANKILIGSASVVAALKSGQEPEGIERSYQPGLLRFMQTRDKYLLY